MRVGIIATGDELVEPWVKPAAAQIRNSNSWQLSSQVHRTGCVPTYFGIAQDTPEAVDEILKMNDASDRQARLMQLKPEFDTLFNSVINEKVQLDWPAAKRNLRIFPLLKLALLDSLPVRRG